MRPTNYSFQQSCAQHIVQWAHFVLSILHMSIFTGMLSCRRYQFIVLVMAAAVEELLNQRRIVLYVYGGWRFTHFEREFLKGRSLHATST